MSDPIFEIGSAGLETTDEKVKSLVNRMVNANTPGFKSSDVTIRSFQTELQAAEDKLRTQKPEVEGTFYSHLQGSLIRTAKQTDFAIGSQGFFTILCPWGEGYTRDGRFYVNKDGMIVSTVGNYPLMGKSGPITVVPNSNISISEVGEIKSDSVYVDTLRIVDFQDKQALESVNGVIFRDGGRTLSMTEVENPRMVQGYIEASNAEVVDQMVDLITLNRLYNLNTKIVSMRDASLTKAMEIGRTQ